MHCISLGPSDNGLKYFKIVGSSAMKFQYERKFSAIVKRRMSESSGNELFYFYVQILSLINIGATIFCKGDIGIANQIAVSTT